jgi:RNA polymerase sigma-70 factor (ECF subfamily)
MSTGRPVDAAGLEAAFLAHGAELYGFAQRRADAWRADQVVQETFTRAWRDRARFDPARTTMVGWLLAIEDDVITDLSHAHHRHEGGVERRDWITLGNDSDNRIVARQAEEAIRALPPEQHQVLVEVYYRGRPCAEVAQSLGVPAQTVRGRLFGALKGLHRALHEDATPPHARAPRP